MDPTKHFSELGQVADTPSPDFSNAVSLKPDAQGTLARDCFLCSSPPLVPLPELIPYFTQMPVSYISFPALQRSYMEFDLTLSFKPVSSQGMSAEGGGQPLQRGRDGKRKDQAGSRQIRMRAD